MRSPTAHVKPTIGTHLIQREMPHPERISGTGANILPHRRHRLGQHHVTLVFGADRMRPAGERGGDEGGAAVVVELDVGGEDLVAVAERHRAGGLQGPPADGGLQRQRLAQGTRIARGRNLQPWRRLHVLNQNRRRTRQGQERKECGGAQIMRANRMRPGREIGHRDRGRGDIGAAEADHGAFIDEVDAAARHAIAAGFDVCRQGHRAVRRNRVHRCGDPRRGRDADDLGLGPRGTHPDAYDQNDETENGDGCGFEMK